MDLGKPIAVGRTASVYPWRDGWVLKVFEDWMGRAAVEYEAQLARAVHATGLPVPAAGEIIEVDGHLGLEYQRVNGENMLELIERQPLSGFRLARRLGELHAELHAIEVEGLPRLRDRLQRKINHSQHLTPELKEAALGALGRLPDAASVCHGDFHPGNVLVASPREVVIDWIDASTGSPLADLARSSVIFLGEAARLGWAGLATRIMHAIYLRRYFQLRPGGRDEHKQWFPVVAAARTSENISPLNAWLVKQASVLLRQPR